MDAGGEADRLGGGLGETWRARLARASTGLRALVDEAFWRARCAAFSLDLPVRAPAAAAFPAARECAALAAVEAGGVATNLPPTEGVPILAVDQGRVFVFG